MKKLYDKTIGGYYVMSVVLGLLLALSVATMLEVAVLDASVISIRMEMDMFWDDVWGYLPLNLCDWFWRPEIGTRNLNILMVTASIMSVGLFVRMSGTKGSRTKILQTVSVALLALLLMLAYGYATRGWIQNAVLAMAPVLLMVIPLTVLRKTQQEHKSLSEVMPEVSEFVQMTWNDCATWQKVGVVICLVFYCDHYCAGYHWTNYRGKFLLKKFVTKATGWRRIASPILLLENLAGVGRGLWG